MKLFGKNTSRMQVTETDRQWVEQNFEWLLMVFGYPAKHNAQFLLDRQRFPQTHSATTLTADHVINDLCRLLLIKREIVSYEFLEDVRDTYGVPYEIEGKPFESETESHKGQHKIFLAQILNKRPKRLIFSLINEFIKIRLRESAVEYEDGLDTGLFLYLAGIFMGFGVILSHNLVDSGGHQEGEMQIRWSYVSEMPIPLMAFSLALYTSLTGNDNPEWKNNLSGELQPAFDAAIDQLKKDPSPLVNEKEMKAWDLYRESDEQYLDNDFETAISTLQKIPSLTADENLKMVVYNNTGYYLCRLGEFGNSITHFEQALELAPEFGFANDNLGYALIMSGNADKGKTWLEKALQCQDNDHAYSFRNLALYHQAKNEVAAAEENFQLAFKAATVPVDLLEYYYGIFLMENGEKEKGLQYLYRAMEKNEPEAIRYVQQLEN